MTRTHERQSGARVVVVGASAGGIDAMLALLQGLPATMGSSILLVLHLPEDHESRLTDVFAARLKLHVSEAVSGGPVQQGCIYLAPAGYHLLVETDQTFSLSCDPPVLFSRPSIDVLMESCADAFGNASAGFVLTGANEDGARGLAAIKAAGGLTAVQDPAQAAHTAMPEAAVRIAGPDHVLPLEGLRELLVSVVRA